MPVSFHIIALFFLFAFGACAGSFLNVVVLRVPATELPENLGLLRTFWRQMKRISYPPSRCPKCNKGLVWHDNLPIVGWLKLGGRCRNCDLSISPRYPIVEAATAVLFVGLYVAIFLLGPAWGPPTPTIELAGNITNTTYSGLRRYEPVTTNGVLGVPPVSYLRAVAEVFADWPVLVIVLMLVWCLLGASMIDAEHFHIPRGLSYLPAVFGVGLHTAFGNLNGPLDVSVGPVGCAWAIGGGAGLLLSLMFLRFGLLRQSFRDELPMLEVERIAAGGSAQRTVVEAKVEAQLVRREMLWELAFLTFPVLLGLLTVWLALGPLASTFTSIAETRPLASGLGAVLGGLVGGGVIWGVRLFGSLAFGREAMGLGDADLMFGVGACLGAGPAAIAVFPAALLGLAFAVVQMLTKSLREMPFGPYLAAASLLLILFYNHVADYVRPALMGLAIVLEPVAPWLGLA